MKIVGGVPVTETMQEAFGGIEELRRLDSHGPGNILVAGDTSQCRRCGQVWDTNDYSPPWCTVREGRVLRFLRWLLGTEGREYSGPLVTPERAQRPADSEADQTHPSNDNRAPREGRPL